MGAGVCAHADETARKIKAINDVSLLMIVSPLEEAQRIGS